MFSMCVYEDTCAVWTYKWCLVYVCMKIHVSRNKFEVVSWMYEMWCVAIYDNALKKNGYRQTLEYTPPKSKLKHRNRNITWFNTPYNKCIRSNIGRDFLNLISKHFPNHSPLAKIFNRNNIKVTYSCTSNMSQIIKATTKRLNLSTAPHTSMNKVTLAIKKHAPY